MVTTGIIRWFFGILVLMSVSFPLQAGADSYDVTASIPYPAPTIAAVIDPSFDGRAVESDVLEVFGTCQDIYPSSIVSLWRGGSLIGSVNCEANGTFRLNVSLLVGQNTIIARTSSLSNAFGPDSNATTVTYTPPAPSQQTATNPTVPSQSQLEISSAEPFALLDDGNGVTIQIIVGGGLGPYTIVVNWGDGSTETLLVDDPGTFSFKHVFTDPGVYKVVATVTDILGVSKIYQFIVASTASPVASPVDKPTLEVVEESNKLLLYSVYGIILFLLLFVLVSSFLLGRRYQFKKMEAQIAELDEQLTGRKPKER